MGIEPANRSVQTCRSAMSVRCVHYVGKNIIYWLLTRNLKKYFQVMRHVLCTTRAKWKYFLVRFNEILIWKLDKNIKLTAASSCWVIEDLASPREMQIYWSCGLQISWNFFDFILKSSYNVNWFIFTVSSSSSLYSA